ncbi:MAG: hypothetical protein WBM78_20885, partial [Desulfobacterales bacterium]
MPNYLPNGAAHIEVQLSPTLVEFAVNKYLTANHPENESGEPRIQASYCIDNLEFIEPAESVHNEFLLRLSLGEYWHQEHFFATAHEIAPVLTLRIAIEDRNNLRISQENIEFPTSWDEAKRMEVQAMIDELMELVVQFPTLPVLL